MPYPRYSLPACVSVRHTPYDELRVTLRLSRIAELRPDFSFRQQIEKAEALACYISKGNIDPVNLRREVEAVAADLASLTELSDA